MQRAQYLAWDHVRRRLPFLADFFGNILTGNGGWSGASGWSGGGRWAASALATGRLLRSPPPPTCAQVARARAHCESVHHLFGLDLQPLVPAQGLRERKLPAREARTGAAE
jgi:hypothetical protein